MGYLFILIYVLIVYLVLRISTYLLVMTGLEPSQSSFQAVSMLTGAGFTTTESELILRHPVRRKLGTALILFGAFSLAVLISAISNLLSQYRHLPVLGGVAAILAALLLLMKIPSVNRAMSHWLATLMTDRTAAVPIPVDELADDEREEDVIGVQIAGDSRWIGKTLSELLPGKEEVLPLAIKRDGQKIRTDRWETKLEEGDFVLLYGKQTVIRNCMKK